MHPIYDGRMFGVGIGTSDDLDGDSFSMEVSQMSSNGFASHQHDPSIDTHTEHMLNTVLDGYHAHNEASQQEMFLSSEEE